MVLELIVLCLSGPPQGKPLAHAFRDGDIGVKAQSHSGHSISLLAIENRRGETVEVNVNGSYLVPDISGYQRLGIGLVRVGDPDTTLTLEPYARVQVKVLSVCMDGSKKSPQTAARYRLARELAPRRVLECLKKWKLDPSIAQDEVQSAVWQGRLPAPPGVTPPAQPEARNATPLLLSHQMARVIVHQGLLLVLTTDGRLLRGLRGTSSAPASWGIIDLWASNVLFALRQKSGGGTTSAPPQTVLSSYDHDSADWRDLPLQVESGKLAWVAPDGSAALILNTRGDLLRCSEVKSSVILKGVCLLDFGLDGKTAWVLQRDPGLLLVADDQGRTTSYRHRTPIRELASTEDGIYLLDQQGSLVGFEAGRPRRLRGEVSSIRTARDSLLVEAAPEGTLAEGSSVVLHLYRGGQPSLQVPSVKGDHLRYLFDAATGQLYCLNLSLNLYRFEESSRSWVVAPSGVRQKPVKASRP